MRLPSAFTVDHDLEGATFHRWLPLDRLLQGGRHPNAGVEQSLVGRVVRIDEGEDGPVGLDGNRRLEREAASGLPRSMDHGYVRVRALPCGAGLRSTRRKHHVFRTGEQERMGGVDWPSGGNAAACLLPVQNVKQWESTTYRFGEEPGNPLKTLTFGSF